MRPAHLNRLVVLAVLAAPLTAPARPRAPRSAVELIDAGDLPRRRLAYRFDLRDESFEVHWQAGSLQVRGLIPGEQRYSPRVSAVWQVRDKQRAAGGGLRFTLVLRFATVEADDKTDAAELARLEALLPALDETFCRGSVEPSGRVTTDCPSAASPEGQRVLDQLARVVATRLVVPLPSLPVGEHARWRAHIAYPDAHIRSMELEATYRLDALDEEGFVVTEQTRFSAPVQRLDAPPESVDAVWLKELTGEGSGGSQHHWARLSPHASDHQFTTEAALLPSPLAAERRAQLDEHGGPLRYLSVTTQHDAIRPHVHQEEER